jgi:hypothetical protein
MTEVTEPSEKIRIGIGKHGRDYCNVVVEPPLNDAEISMLVDGSIITRDRIHLLNSGGIKGTHITVTDYVYHTVYGSSGDREETLLTSNERSDKASRVANSIADILRTTRTQEIDLNPNIIYLNDYQKRPYNPLSE